MKRAFMSFSSICRALDGKELLLDHIATADLLIFNCRRSYIADATCVPFQFPKMGSDWKKTVWGGTGFNELIPPTHLPDKVLREWRSFQDILLAQDKAGRVIYKEDWHGDGSVAVELNTYMDWAEYLADSIYDEVWLGSQLWTNEHFDFGPNPISHDMRKMLNDLELVK